MASRKGCGNASDQSVMMMGSLWCVVLIVSLGLTNTELHNTGNKEKKLWAYSTITPHVYHRNDGSKLRSTKDKNGHFSNLILIYELQGKNYTVDLRLNRELIPHTFYEKHLRDDEFINASDVEICQYQGKIRGISGSWAAISTCDGLRGIIYDGNEVLHLKKQASSNSEPDETSSLFNDHILYRQLPIKHNGTCGHSEVIESSHLRLDSDSQGRQRVKRSTSDIKVPYYMINKEPRYVELLFVVDNTLYWRLTRSRRNVGQHCLHLANLVNALYAPLNIFIALIGVIVWENRDQIYIEDDSHKVLNEFLRYRREHLVEKHPNDNAQLLTAIKFKHGIVGKAYPHSMCTYEHSGAVVQDDIEHEEIVAATVAHEMGHNFGMQHDAGCCQCERCCIMGVSTSSIMPTKWSPCNLEELGDSLHHHIDFCLQNKPVSIYSGPVCGNGFVEHGEECDCGLEHYCKNPCCDPSTCLLHQNASCGTGKCCDFETCQPKIQGTECRTSASECDLPEYCNGVSEYCPDNIYKMDGSICKDGQAFCYQGSCTTHTDQCRKLWGPTAINMDDECYKNNDRGNRNGHCGYNRISDRYTQCEKKDLYCGILQCSHRNEKLEFGIDSYAKIGNMLNYDTNEKCTTAIVDLGLNVVQPGLVPNGAKCGENKMCFNQKCVPVETVQSSTCYCNGNGVCNSKSQCHCDIGYAPPFCNQSGLGGSVHSNAPINPHAREEVKIAFYVIFLGILPIILIILMIKNCSKEEINDIWKITLNYKTSPATTTESANLHHVYQWERSPQSCTSIATEHSEEANNHHLNTRPPRPTRPAPKVPPKATVQLDIRNPTLVSTTNMKMFQTLRKQHESNSMSSEVTENSKSNRKSSFLSSVENFTGTISSRLSFSKRRAPVNNSTPPATATGTVETSNTNVKVKSVNLYSNQTKKVRKPSNSLSLKFKQEPVRERLVETSDSCHSSPETAHSERVKIKVSTSSTSSWKNTKERKRIDPYKKSLLGTSDSCPTTPETPPTEVFLKKAPQFDRPSVANLVSKLEKA